MIRVAIIDDHALVRDGLRRMLSAADDIEVVGEGADGAEAAPLVARAAPDVLLLDLSMPSVDGFSAAAEVAESAWGGRVLVLTMYDEPHYAERALAAGASGFIGKDASFEELCHAIREVHRTARHIPGPLAEQLSKAAARPAPRLDQPRVLSSREEEVLRLLAAGLTNREIAAQLSLSIKTVDTHRGHILKKLGLRTNADLTRYAVRHRLVPC